MEQQQTGASNSIINKEAACKAVKSLQQLIDGFNEELSLWSDTFGLSFNIGFDYTTDKGKSIKLLAVDANLFQPQVDLEKVRRALEQLPDQEQIGEV